MRFRRWASEDDVDASWSTHHKELHALVAKSVGEAHRRDSVEHSIERGDGFESGECRTDAEVDAEAEAEVLVAQVVAPIE